MKLTSAQDIKIQAVWPSSISPVPSPMVDELGYVGRGAAAESALAAFRCLYLEQQAMKTEGSAEGTDFVHRNKTTCGEASVGD